MLYDSTFPPPHTISLLRVPLFRPFSSTRCHTTTVSFGAIFLIGLRSYRSFLLLFSCALYYLRTPSRVLPALLL